MKFFGVNELLAKRVEKMFNVIRDQQEVKIDNDFTNVFDQRRVLNTAVAIS